jgi:tellurite resistance protein TerC
MEPSLARNDRPASDARLATRSGVLHVTYRMARRLVVATVGTSVLLLGVVLLVTPGPALVVIPIGLGILSIEFSWARRWLKKVKDAANGALSARSSSCDDAVR